MRYKELNNVSLQANKWSLDDTKRSIIQYVLEFSSKRML